MTEGILFLGCIIVLAVFVAVLVRCRTLLFGFTALNVFAVGSATLSGFIVGTLFGLPMDWFTDGHAEVVAYMIPGLLAMAAGIYLGWRPLREAEHSLTRLQPWTLDLNHLNQEVGWITFWIGVMAELAWFTVNRIPTVSTAVYALSLLERVGLCILLVSALRNGTWARFLMAFAVFGVLSIAGSLVSGFSFIRVNTLFPLIAIFLALFGLRLRSVLPLLLALPVGLSMSSAWLETRILIRSGSLEELSLLDKASVFLQEYFLNLGIPDPHTIMATIRERVDMTDIFAEQVYHQPDVEPYAYGDTVWSSFYTLIPRAIWPEKPEVAGGSEFVQIFTGLSRPFDDTTSIGLPYPFELYANGGPFLVIVGLGVIGYVCAKLELALFSTPKSLGGFWALALVTVVLSEGGQRTDVVLPAVVSAALTAYLLGYVVERFWLSSGMRSVKFGSPGPVVRGD